MPQNTTVDRILIIGSFIAAAVLVFVLYGEFYLSDPTTIGYVSFAIIIAIVAALILLKEIKIWLLGIYEPDAMRKWHQDNPPEEFVDKPTSKDSLPSFDRTYTATKVTLLFVIALAGYLFYIGEIVRDDDWASTTATVYIFLMVWTAIFHRRMWRGLLWMFDRPVMDDWMKQVSKLEHKDRRKTAKREREIQRIEDGDDDEARF